MPDFLRKPNRLESRSYVGFGEYFLTLCTHARKRLFVAATSRRHPSEPSTLVEALLGALRETCSAHHFTIAAYCFMPDHLHLLSQAQTKDCDLRAFVKAFKGQATAAARPLGAHQLWQKGYYDHVIRNSESASEIAWYIFLNPVRAELVRAGLDWPYSGSFVFDWKTLPTPAQPYVPPWK